MLVTVDFNRSILSLDEYFRETEERRIDFTYCKPKREKESNYQFSRQSHNAKYKRVK